MEGVAAVLIVCAAAYALKKWRERSPGSVAPYRAIAGGVGGVIGGVAGGLVGGVAGGLVGGASLGVVGGISAGKWLRAKWPQWAEARAAARDRRRAVTADQKTRPVPYVAPADATVPVETGTSDDGQTWGPAVVDTPEGPVEVQGFRNADGTLPPETERAYQERLAGYDGWLDQDGHRVDDLDKWIADQEAGTEPHPADSAATEGTEPMTTITSSTGGETLTMDQLLQELKDIAKDAASELEDANADMKRATDDANRVDNMVACLEAADVGQETLGAVSPLAESAAQKRKAAEMRADAADARLAQAERALDVVQRAHGVMQEAHNATAHPAQRQFYGS